MKVLVIDTATNLLVVGLKNDDKNIIRTRLGKNDNAAYLVNEIEVLLNEENIKLENLDKIIVGIGPGSYTGNRVAVVVAKTLAYSKNIKLEKISSLLLLSSGYQNITAAIDARRGFYFANNHSFGKSISGDNYISLDNLKENKDYIILNENTIKVDLDIIINNSEEVKDVFLLEPNYLRKTEAENEYDQKNGIK
ncbi:tRNA (adenosine(37)-N6)-threonylcarbamoyltransferase complex dimerization subunit type 1 TsaB [Haploplasma modicum]|uniref:tRNA (adenosine(37)-N6)-threonylcarbamoyltransferase complex dimerization subunit type 1 TsaB n=1 Tax=Haploplasma modicum TaxID=2150 RepID=UPI00214A998E|nr:tRNA (adenosine(37)-N6)-threonylcarbamoyltransferase complex dimerization subunit type 1 TsaB [Haploplasma modicum]MCR1809327.1 tRNA (adenosine(37)-N6)-threonylcarbamoyltransferase complex dimerization subunit type 1 TsaB [Haploplasma modicum]